MTIDLHIPLFERGAGGVPTTQYTGIDLTPWVNTYEDSVTATGGFESIRVDCTVDMDLAVDALMRWLGRSTVVYGPDAEVVSEGQLVSITTTFGQEQRSLSFDGIANRVHCRFTTVNGISGWAPLPVGSYVSDATSIATYGTFDSVLSLPQSTSTEATNFATAELARRKWPMGQPSTEVASGDFGGVQLSLLFEGWYASLGRVLTERTDTSTETTTTQVAALIGTSSPGIGATNPFLSTSTLNITSSGISATRYIAPDTPYRQKIEALLRQGNSAGHRLAWGVYEDRMFYVTQWAGATPDTIHYRRHLGDSRIFDLAGSIVSPWNIRPDRMLEVADLLDVGSPSGAPDSAARFYVERVTRTVDSSGRVSVRLEPSATDSLDARLARIGGA